jgi:triphosphatase
MLERELKLHVPAAARDALEAELLRLGAATTRLRARYFDTDDRQLAEADVALRLRLEGEQWVQTVKAPGPDELSREEFNHPRPSPELDLSLYADAEVGKILTPLAQALQVRYETDIQRMVLRIDTGSGVVELAYDNGVVKSGPLQLAVHELELELVSGAADNLFILGQFWLEKYGSILDLRSKAERGDALAGIVSARPDTKQRGRPSLSADELRLLLEPRRARRPKVDKEATMLSVYQQSAGECLSQIVRNACLLAGVDKHSATAAMDTEYVHQLRVGIRRLRSCSRLFRKWIPCDGQPSLQELKSYFSMLGRERDADVVRLAVTPLLLEAGMPPVDMPDSGRPTRTTASRRLAASTGFQSCLLMLFQDLIALAESAKESGEIRRPARQLTKRLDTWLDQLCTEGVEFRALPIEAQHELRKKVKRLRYSLDFVTPLMTGKRLKRLKRIRRALGQTQESLGALNDLYVAEAYYAGLGARSPGAMFALGWLAASQAYRRQQAEASFIKLRAAGRLTD